MALRFWFCATITTISALVSAGFSVVGLLGPSGSDIFARYAASRSIALLVAAARMSAFVEHPFGTIKARMGATHFLMKTFRQRVASEMAHTIGHNLTPSEHHGIQPRWRRSRHDSYSPSQRPLIYASRQKAFCTTKTHLGHERPILL